MCVPVIGREEESERARGVGQGSRPVGARGGRGEVRRRELMTFLGMRQETNAGMGVGGGRR